MSSGNRAGCSFDPDTTLNDLFHTVKVILVACRNPDDMMRSVSEVVTHGRAKVQLQ
jgi:hypothetical protein